MATGDLLGDCSSAGFSASWVYSRKPGWCLGGNCSISCCKLILFSDDHCNFLCFSDPDVLVLFEKVSSWGVVLVVCFTY